MKTYYICVNESKDRKYVEHPDYATAEKEAIRLNEKHKDDIKIFKIEAVVKAPTKYVIEKAEEVFVPSKAYIDQMAAVGAYWYDNGWHLIPKYGSQPRNAGEGLSQEIAPPMQPEYKRCL